MNILIVSYYQVYPPTSGAGIAQFATLEYLSNVCNISLLISEKFSLSQKDLSDFKSQFPKIKIYNMQKSLTSSNNQEIRTRNIGCKLIYFFLYLLKQLKNHLKQKVLLKKKDSKDISQEEEFEIFFTPKQSYTHSKSEIDIITQIIEKDKIDIVQIEFFDNLSLVSAIPESVKKIFICHESRFARIQSHIEAKNIHSHFTNYVLNLNKTIELSFLEKFDAILSFTEYDSLEIKEALGEKNKAKFATIPLAILDRDLRKLDINYVEPIKKLVFIGEEGHFPNKDATEWFLNEAATEILLKYGLRLYVIGNWSKETIAKYQHHPSNVYFTGFINDISEILKGSISIAPIRIGGGIKTKILFAMAQGIPVICTKFAATGINVKHLESVMLAEDKDSFCRAVQYYLEDSQRTFSMCMQAQNILNHEYSQRTIAKLRYSFYQDCLGKAY